MTKRLKFSTELKLLPKKIKFNGFKGANVVVSSINCQESLNGGVLVSVLGTIQTKRDNGEMNAARAFQQVFYLGVQSEPAYSYFVLNDIFLFVNTSVSPSPKASPIVATYSPFTVTSVPKEASPIQAHHSPIPAPQTVTAPVSVVVEQKPAPVQSPSAPAPTPAKSETQVIATTSSSSQEKPEKPHKKPREQKKSPSNTSASSTTATATNNGDFIIKKAKEPKTPRTKKDNKEGGNSEGEKKQPKNTTRQNGNRKNEKKAENQEKATTERTYHSVSASSSNGAVSTPKSNSWASVAFVNDEKPVFAPPAIVYEAPIAKVEDAKPVEKKEQAEKPKKIREPKKETAEETAMKRTRELRSIRVSNLPYEVEEKAVIDLFKQFGDIKEVVLKKGFAYVEYHTLTGATNSLNHVKKNTLEILDPKSNKTRSLSVEQRKPRVTAEPDKPFYKDDKLALEKKKEQTTTTTTTVPPS